jgi:uncharacterized membrane protein
MKQNSEIRAAARGALSGNWANAVVALIIFEAIVYVANVLPVIGTIGSFVVGGPLAYGLILLFLGIARKGETDFNVLFKGFNFNDNNSGLFIRLLGAYILSTIFILLWSLLLIIPGIIAGLGYSMIFYIFADNPDISISDALKQSKKMMYGYKWKLFLLQLSFIGWALLCILTFGIGFLWLGPYMQAATTQFYLELKKEHGYGKMM